MWYDFANFVMLKSSHYAYNTSFYFLAKIHQIDESLYTCVKLVKGDFKCH